MKPTPIQIENAIAEINEKCGTDARLATAEETARFPWTIDAPNGETVFHYLEEGKPHFALFGFHKGNFCFFAN